MNDATVMRMMDANGNRAREALRVMEDYARFGLNDATICGELKAVRHGLAEALALAGAAEGILFRDTAEDVGTGIKTAGELRRDSIGDVVIAAGKRLSESLRVLEECAKTVEGEAAAAIEKLRYRGYVVEQTLSRFAGGAGARERFAKVRLVVLLTESLCHAAAGGWEKMLDAVLEAGGGGGERVCVQLREKGLEDAELLRRAKIVAAKCRAAGAVSIINDRPDIALLAGADGVHLGQTDLPCAEARKILGTGAIVGVSTENLEQARAAMRSGATYVAAGPMFPTKTKEKPRIAGPAYAAEAVRELPAGMPLVAIGGIDARNVGEVLAAGVRCVAVCAAVIGQAEPVAATKLLLSRLAESIGECAGKGVGAMTKVNLDPPQLRARGFAVLVEALGWVNVVRFVQQYESSQLNYMEERDAIFHDMGAGELMRQMKALKPPGTDAEI